MSMTEHISKQFEADLDTTRTRVLQMGGLVEAQILAAIQAFTTGDAALVAQVIANDARVNGYEVAIDGACNHIVVKRQPAASDLRLIMAISKIVTDLERIGDEAEKIARMAKRIHEHGAPPCAALPRDPAMPRRSRSRCCARRSMPSRASTRRAPPRC